MEILFVCTANVCRSPYAAAAVNSFAQAEGLDIHATSAGMRVDMLKTTGMGTCPEMPYNSARPSGFVVPRPEDHGSTQLEFPAVKTADLIVVFEPAHRAHVMQLQPRAQLRTYSVMQLARLTSAVLADHWPDAAPEPTGDVLRDLNLARSWAPFSENDIVPDPHGHGVQAHLDAADVVDGLVVGLVRVIAKRDTAHT